MTLRIPDECYPFPHADHTPEQWVVTRDPFADFRGAARFLRGVLALDCRLFRADARDVFNAPLDITLVA